MADLSLEILLKILADTMGAEKAQEVLAKVKAEAGEGAETTGALADATQDLGEKQEEAGGKAEHYHISHRAIHQILHLIGHEAGPAAGAAISGITAAMMGGGGIMLGVMAFRQLFEAIKQSNEEAKKFQENMATGEFSKGMEAMRKQVADSAAEMQKYSDARGELAKHEVTIAQALAVQLEYMKAIAAEEERLAKAVEARQKAERELKEATGQFTPGQKIAADTEADMADARAEAKRKKDLQDKEMDDRQKALANMGIQEPTLEQNESAARAALDAAKKHNANAAADFGGSADDFRKKQEALQEELEKKEKALKNAEFENNQHKFDDPTTRALYEKKAQDAKDDRDLAQKKIELESRGRSQYEASQTPEAAIAMQKLQDAYDTAHKKTEENTSGMAKLGEEIKNLNATIAGSKAVIDAELEERIKTILTNAMKQLATSGGQVGQLGTGEERMKGLADLFEQDPKNLSSDQMNLMEQFVNNFGLSQKQKDAGVKIVSAKAAADWIENSLGTQQQMFEVLERFIELGASHKKLTEQQAKDLKTMKELIDNMAKMNGL